MFKLLENVQNNNLIKNINVLHNLISINLQSLLKIIWNYGLGIKILLPIPNKVIKLIV
jgi:hypothetical protein